MTEQEFKESLLKMKYSEDSISESLELYKEMNKKNNLSLEKWHSYIVNINKRNKDMPEDYVSVD